ncbi:MAG: NAD(P)H-quinone oxidoreductase [Kordiimonadales bacterium]|nr:MAG: NAD(P)H-quinone oxidoreductase [Kordiimonadales bacterium]
MLAIEIREPGGPEVLQPCEREKPTPAAGEVLAEVKAAGVNRPDVIQRLGLYPAPPGASDIPGLEIAGVIVAVGEGVTADRIGEKVCALVAGGGYAEFCTAPIETLLPIPEGLSFAEAAAIPETFFTVWSNVFDRAGLQEGEAFLVHGGSSGIGSTAIQLAKAFGATVFTTAGSDAKTAFCRELGADFAINYRDEDFVERIKGETDGKGVNVVLDMVGGTYIAKNIECLALEGRHVSIAFLTGPQVDVNMMPVMLKRLVMTGSTLRARSNAFKGDVASALKEKVWPLIEAGKVRPVIDSVFDCRDAAKAHTLMQASTHKGKIILSFEK